MGKLLKFPSPSSSEKRIAAAIDGQESPVYQISLEGQAAQVVAESGMEPEEAVLNALGLFLRYRQVRALGGDVLIRIPGEDDFIPLTFQNSKAAGIDHTDGSV